MDEPKSVAAQLGGMSEDQLKQVGVSVNAALDPKQLSAMWGSFANSTPPELASDVLGYVVEKLPQGEQTSAVVSAIEQLPQEQQQQIIREVSRSLPPPSAQTRDSLWMIVVVSFCIVFVGSFLALAVCVFIQLPKDNKASPELLLAMFTTVVGFLAGLFVPSPTNSKGGSA